jgi:glycosyltransferase involved in cell wall biosynthesis
MKIGIDAKWYYTGNPSGKVVVQNLVRELAEGGKGHELYIFLDRKDKDKPFPYEGGNIHVRYVWAGINMLSNVLVMPLAAYSLHLDIVIFQYFAPAFSNFRRYSFIHDVIFKSNPEYYTLIERLYFLPLRMLANRSHGVCTVSEAEKKRMMRYGYRPDGDIDVIYHGVDGIFKPGDEQDPALLRRVREKYSLPERYLLYVGRLNVRKNVFNLLRAVALLKHDIPLVVVGGYDWKMTSVDGLVSQLGIGDRLVFSGPIHGEELAAVYAMADVFCFPSFEESFGLPALEGMASGVPVVVSDRSSLPEVCGEAGNYADPDSPGDIAAVIDGLLDDPALREQKRRLGLARSGRFRWERSASELVRNAARVCGMGNNKHFLQRDS